MSEQRETETWRDDDPRSTTWETLHRWKDDRGYVVGSIDDAIDAEIRAAIKADRAARRRATEKGET